MVEPYAGEAPMTPVSGTAGASELVVGEQQNATTREIIGPKDISEKKEEYKTETSSLQRVSGRVKWFNWNKGFGFITVDGSDEEVFVHQSNIEAEGFRSLHENEVVEFELVVGVDGKKKAFHVTGPGGVAPRGVQLNQHRSARVGHMGLSQGEPYSSSGSPMLGQPQFAQMGAVQAGQNPQGYYPAQLPPEAFFSQGYYQVPGSAYPHAFSSQQVVPTGAGGYFPGGQNWAGARPPPPGQPGFSSGLQVVVHNLPWDCTWQELKAAFEDIGEIERADVVFDSQGRSRGFGIVRFPDRQSAELAVERMNNKTIGGRIVSVRVDRFA